MVMEHEQAHLLDPPAPELPTASVPPPARQSISFYFLLLGALLLFFWFGCRMSCGSCPTMAKRAQSNLVRWLNCQTMTRLDWLNFLEIFTARLILEVFGGAGAIWGFSEAIGFRTDNTVWFWRPAALTIGAVFFSRWLLQIRDFMNEHAMSSNNLYKEINMVDRIYSYESATDEMSADGSELLMKFQYGRASRRGSYGATSSCERLPRGKRHSIV